jgi:2,3-bisphosphoglycerate-independent phosphoglycerate mutase
VAAKLPGFTDMYEKTGSLISAVPLCQGIGVLLGLEKIYVEGATGELHTNYEGKMEAAIEALKTKDFVTVHVEAPDECTHNGDLTGKIQAIEWIDSKVLAPLLKRLRESKIDFRMLMMTDHRTLISTRGHDSGLVPYVLYDSREDKKTGMRYCEESAKRSKHVTSGTDLMRLLFRE